MLNPKYIRSLFVIACLIALAIGGCTSGEDKTGGAQTLSQGPEVQPPDNAGAVPPAATTLSQTAGIGTVVDVDGTKLAREQLDAEVTKKLAAIKKQVPADQLGQVRENIRQQVINDFVMRVLLTNEVNRLKITASDNEVKEAVDRLKSNLPKGMTIEDLMKKNKLTKAKMNEDIRFGIKVNKLVMSQAAAKAKPSDQEIADFYEKNKEKFKMPESVRVRHILVANPAGNNDKIKAEKRAKAEDLRKQLIAGADFAEIAKKNSDCPSKESGGDLGVFTRGEMVKQFDDAAFSQAVNAIGPVVETEFGFHIIQVLEKYGPRILALDERMKANISALMQQQKQQEAFETIIKRLRAKANVVVYQN